MAARSLSLLLLLVCAPSARAEWKILSCATEANGPAGVVHLRTITEDAEIGEHAELHLAAFHSRTATLRVIDRPKYPEADLAQVMRAERCIAGVNGGYFDAANEPIGLRINDGRMIAPLRRARLLSGMMLASDGRVQLLRVAEYNPKRKAIAALQCGPFLVDGGKPVAGLDPTRSARRTFILAGGADRAAIGICSEVTLAQLGEILAAPGVAGELKVQRALNLDGGSSSGFWFVGEHGGFSISEEKSVRDFVAVVAK
ncbi:MAG TPA: phosphodiester glycosidase family protein [Chthoniobacterales bacterium]